MGAWIEILNTGKETFSPESLPLWERGLKFRENGYDIPENTVAPSMGAWIEIVRKAQPSWMCLCRSLYGSVD